MLRTRVRPPPWSCRAPRFSTSARHLLGASPRPPWHPAYSYSAPSSSSSSTAPLVPSSSNHSEAPFHILSPPSPSSPSSPQPPLTPFSPTPPAPTQHEHDHDERPDKSVSDAEWEIRVGRGMLHLRETLPRLFAEGIGTDDLFPPDVFSPNVVLKLPVPFPVRIPGLTGYKMAFAAGRSGLVALHTDLGTTLERMTFSPPTPPHSLADTFKHTPPQRHKQIRVLLAVHGTPRLPPHHQAQWTTSNLYTFNPYSGLIASHEVEAIRPLPGEGVGEWVMSRLLGWTRRNPAPAPTGGSGL